MQAQTHSLIRIQAYYAPKLSLSLSHICTWGKKSREYMLGTDMERKWGRMQNENN